MRPYAWTRKMAYDVMDDVARLAHLSAIVNGSDDAIVSKDLQGRILSWNRGAERLFGFTAAEAIGKPMTIIFPPDRLQEEAVILAKIARGEQVDHYEAIRRRKDGRLVEVSVTVSPVRDAKGRIVAASKIARDVSESRRLQRELAASNARLRQLDAERRAFLNMVAHELRTPLTPILMQIQLVRELGNDPQAMRHAFDVIERNMSRLNTMVQQVLEIARLEGAKVPLAPQRVDLRALAHETVQTFLANARQVDVTLELAPGAEAWVWADPDRIAQVLVNLVSNALKFTGPGGRIVVKAEALPSTSTVTVRDDGAGMNAEQLNRLFQPFVQVHEGKAGSGLGLYISRELARQHGGDLVAESPGVGLGSVFTLSLPTQGPPASGSPSPQP